MRYKKYLNIFHKQCPKCDIFICAKIFVHYNEVENIGFKKSLFFNKIKFSKMSQFFRYEVQKIS
jgi:hypothetical protein